jgi:hypothetical protein
MPKPSPISERDLQQAVRRLFHNHQYVLVNSFVFNWESDLFSVTKSGNVYEVEMKISKADYKKDFEKEKHFLFKHSSAGRVHECNPEEETGHVGYNYDWDPKTQKSIWYPYCRSKWHDSSKFFIPNRFYYACPPGIIDPADLPKYAGLIHASNQYDARIIRQAPLMHKRYLLDEKMAKKLLLKFWYLSQNQRYHLQANNIDYKDCGEGPQSENKLND